MVSGLSGKKILITGATGFIGANLTHRLINLGVRPNIIIRRESNLWRIKKALNKINLHYADLTDKKRLKIVISKIKPNIICHCAAYGGYYFQKKRDKIFGINIMGTINLLEACSRINFDCFINTGTSSEYGIKDYPMKESDLLEPLTDYAVAKAAQTLYCQSLASREKLPIITLRLFSPYGYYEDKHRLVASVITSCLNKKNPKLSTPGPFRDFIFIDDVIDAYIKVMQNPDKAKGEVFNIGCGRQYSVGQTVDKIISLISKKIKPLWESLSNPRIEPSSWVADVSKAKALINWQPDNSLQSGLKKTVDWFKENLTLYNGKD